MNSPPSTANSAIGDTDGQIDASSESSSNVMEASPVPSSSDHSSSGDAIVEDDTIVKDSYADEASLNPADHLIASPESSSGTTLVKNTPDRSPVNSAGEEIPKSATDVESNSPTDVDRCIIAVRSANECLVSYIKLQSENDQCALLSLKEYVDEANLIKDCYKKPYEELGLLDVKGELMDDESIGVEKETCGVPLRNEGLIVYKINCQVCFMTKSSAGIDWTSKATGQLMIKCKEDTPVVTKDAQPSIIFANENGNVVLNALIYPFIKIDELNCSVIAILDNVNDDKEEAVTQTFLFKMGDEDEASKLATAIRSFSLFH